MDWMVADPYYVTGRGMEELPAGPSLAVMLDCVAMGEEFFVAGIAQLPRESFRQARDLSASRSLLLRDTWHPVFQAESSSYT